MFARLRFYFIALIILCCVAVGAFAQDINSIRSQAQSGDANAQLNIGLLYENGDGVQQDDALAAKWYRKAAEQGNKYAQYNLAFLIAKNGGSLGNTEEFVKWMRKAAEQGYSYAQFELGTIYASGEGVALNYTEAEKWLRKAAEQGHGGAQYSLGVLYANGNGVRENQAEAVRWYRKAAEQGNASGQFGLGLKYGKGEGVSQNDILAYLWATLSASQGHEEGKNVLQVLETIMSQEQIAKAKKLSVICRENNYKGCEQLAIKPERAPKPKRDCSILNQNFKLYFESESVKLTPSAKDVINQAYDNVGSLEESFEAGDCGNFSITITGHTDRYGSERKNEYLSLAMAQSVSDYLIARYDFSSKDIIIASKGETDPAKPTKDNAKAAINRRVTVAFEFSE